LLRKIMKKIAVLGMALLVAVLVARGGVCQERSPSSTTTTPVSKDVIPKAWLKKKTTVANAEQAHLVKDKRLGPKPVPFGFINARWEQFKAGMRLGDELWEFESPGPSWEHLAGRAGLCIVREGRIIDALITRMN
jgi:hypothetical protein